jgi:3-dehydroquinate synthase
VVLVGLPGAGKTSVGKALGQLLDVDFVDTDDEIVRMTGRDISEIFAHDGEAGFRSIEAAAVIESLAQSSGVLALGGGAVLSTDVRSALRDARVPVVFLAADTETLLERMAGTDHRPLLVGDRPRKLAAAAAERDPLYLEVATIEIDTAALTIGQAAAEIARRLHGPDVVDRTPDGPAITTIPVTGDHAYDVLIGRGVLGRLAGMLTGARRVAVIHAAVLDGIAESVTSDLKERDIEPLLIEVPDAEAAKTIEVAGRCFDALGAARFTRSDAIVGLGGGATTDLAGWVAASWLRGVPVVQIPTTLAGMVDAAVGGKTGINTDRGKNLVGAFHPPAGVICDLDLLETLPVRAYRAGLAEVIKTGFIADPRILELIEQHPSAVSIPGNRFERELVERTIAVKARVVSEDLTEQGLREILNYGHTLGHAIERVEGYTWLHGDAVSVGLVFAAALGRELGCLDLQTAARHEAVLGSVGLPVRYRGVGLDELLDVMRLDKKARGSRLRFVVLEGLARPVTISDPDPAAISAAYAKVARDDD